MCAWHARFGGRGCENLPDPYSLEQRAMNEKVILKVSEGVLSGQEFLFTERTTCIIGRAEEANLRLPNNKDHQIISRYHCLLDINPPADLIIDEKGPTIW